MTESKIKVPEGMLKAAIGESYLNSDHDKAIIKSAVEDALAWLSKNPIVPTREQWVQLENNHPTMLPWERVGEWQKRMFFTPEPNPAVEKIKQALTGCTLTAGDAAELMDAVRRCTKPEQGGRND